MNQLPGPLLEAVNGIMLILFGCMLLSAAAYFIQQLRSRTFATVYFESKASFAASILFFGLFARTAIIWWSRHLQDHGQQLGKLENYFTLALIVTAIPIIWGSVCWMNAVLPLRFGPMSWFFVTLGAVLFGIFMAL
jgi:hypothetical protein